MLETQNDPRKDSILKISLASALHKVSCTPVHESWRGLIYHAVQWPLNSGLLGGVDGQVKIDHHMSMHAL
jgi:hypothetical protein